MIVLDQIGYTGRISVTIPLTDFDEMNSLKTKGSTSTSMRTLSFVLLPVFFFVSEVKSQAKLYRFDVYGKVKLQLKSVCLSKINVKLGYSHMRRGILFFWISIAYSHLI